MLLPGVVFVRSGVVLTERLLAHELAHVDQVARLGLLRYWSTYLTGLARHGYARHGMEEEARRAEADAGYRARAARILLEASRG